MIEDNPTNLELLLFLLRANGHAPFSARDGIVGLRLANDMLPDLIICDIQLPTIDGYEVARRIKSDERLQSITLIAVTACAMPADRERALAAGFDGYISKPISPYTFCEELSRFLSAAGAESTSNAGPGVAGADILIAEHSNRNLGVLKAVLEPTGYCFHVVRSVDEALEILRHELPSLLIAELDLTGGGAETLVHARDESPSHASCSCLILVPAGADRDSPKRLQRLECDLMHWPIDPAGLLRWVRTHRSARSIHEAGVCSP